MVKVF